MIGGSDGDINEPLLRDRTVADGVDVRDFGEKALDERPPLPVIFEPIFARLVGDVQKAALRVSLLFEEGAERGQESFQKRRVSLTVRGGIPTKDALLRSLRLGNDLGRRLRAPLREEMGKFEIFHPRAVGAFQKFCKKLKVERVTRPLFSDLD